jgi:radical SAM superfamily enzyme YgiQ (UPF0313 family)
MLSSCFIQVGNDMTIQHKIILRYLEQQTRKPLIFDRLSYISGLRDFEIYKPIYKWRQGLTVDSFPYLKDFIKTQSPPTDRQDLFKWIEQNKLQRYDRIFITFGSRNIIEFTFLCMYLKVMYQKRIIVGGGIVEFFKDYLEFLKENKIIDCYVSGPGEKAVEQILNNQSITTEIYNPKHIYPGYEDYENGVCSVISMRGCTFSCNHCCSFNDKLNIVKPEILGQWIEKVFMDHKVNKFLISSCYFYPKNYFVRFYQSIEHLLGKISFTFAYVTQHLIDKETIKMFKKMKIGRLSIGIETFSQRLLDMLNKKTTVEKNIQVLDLLQKNHIEYWPERMFMLPTETIDEFKYSLKMFQKYTKKPSWDMLNYDVLVVNKFRLSPYTPMYNDKERYGIQINFFPDTSIMESWYEENDKNLSLYNRKLKILNQEN